MSPATPTTRDHLAAAVPTVEEPMATAAEGPGMMKRVLGGSGIAVSPIGLGTSTWGEGTDEPEAAKQLLEFMRRAGNLLDTANIYGGGRSEEIIGRLLRRTATRADIVIATKAVMVGEFPPYRVDASPKQLLLTLDGSLKRMGTDYVDLWQLHTWDPKTPIDETIEALDTAITSGRARAVGVCNYSGWKTALTATMARCTRPWSLATLEVEYSLLQRGPEREVIPAAQELGLGVLPWAPLGRGVLTGKYRGGVEAAKQRSSLYQWYVRPYVEHQRSSRTVDLVSTLAAELGTTPAVIALSWVKDRQSVIAPLVGARTAEQLRESLGVLDFDLPEAAREQLDSVSAPYVGYPERTLY